MVLQELTVHVYEGNSLADLVRINITCLCSSSEDSIGWSTPPHTVDSCDCDGVSTVLLHWSGRGVHDGVASLRPIVQHHHHQWSRYCITLIDTFINLKAVVDLISIHSLSSVWLIPSEADGGSRGRWRDHQVWRWKRT